MKKTRASASKGLPRLEHFDLAVKKIAWTGEKYKFNTILHVLFVCGVNMYKLCFDHKNVTHINDTTGKPSWLSQLLEIGDLAQ